MPWDVDDVDRHMKDLSASEKETWVEVANDALAACEKAGRKDCDASAIRQANAVIGKLKEGEIAADDSFDYYGDTVTPDTIPLKDRLRAAIDADDLVEAATFKTMVQGLLKSANGVATHKGVPKVVRAKIQELRTLLHKTWGDLSDTTSAPAGEGTTQAAAAASEAIGDPSEGSEEFVEVGALVACEPTPGLIPPAFEKLSQG